MTEDGTKNIYELDLQTLDEVRRHLDSFWEASLASLKKAAATSRNGRCSDERP